MRLDKDHSFQHAHATREGDLAGCRGRELDGDGLIQRQRSFDAQRWKNDLGPTCLVRRSNEGDPGSGASTQAHPVWREAFFGNSNLYRLAA